LFWGGIGSDVIDEGLVGEDESVDAHVWAVGFWDAPAACVDLFERALVTGFHG
jgi:hypothetical protein